MLVSPEGHAGGYQSLDDDNCDVGLAVGKQHAAAGGALYCRRLRRHREEPPADDGPRFDASETAWANESATERSSFQREP
jgi:hypothetical protein